MNEPRTAREWQEAVDLAVGVLAIAEAKIEAAPPFDAARCKEIIAKGAALGFKPTPRAAATALEIFGDPTWRDPAVRQAIATAVKLVHQLRAIPEAKAGSILRDVFGDLALGGLVWSCAISPAAVEAEAE